MPQTSGGREILVVTCNLKPAPRAALLETIRDQADVVFLGDLDATRRKEALRDAAAVLARNPAEELRDGEATLLRNARLVQLVPAGVDFIPLDQFPAEIPLASNAGAHAESMAEHALAMALAAAKHLAAEHAKMKLGEFNQAGPTRMIAECTCGIFGLGGTGIALARLLKALGAAVHGINRRGESIVPIDWTGTPDQLDHLLALSDIFFVTAPLTKATLGVIGRRELRLMRPDAILVNVARGELIDEGALFAHLRDNPAFVACIDAWWIEPARPGRFEMRFAFLDLPNVIASPHNAAAASSGRANGVRRAGSIACARSRGKPRSILSLLKTGHGIPRSDAVCPARRPAVTLFAIGARVPVTIQNVRSGRYGRIKNPFLRLRRRGRKQSRPL